MHLEGIAGGKSYAEVSAAFMADQKNEELGAQRQSLFMGETLRGMLLSAWGWGTVGTIATIAGIILIGMGAILLSIPLLAAFADRRRTAPATRTSTVATPTA
jgi:hypothetical protein